MQREHANTILYLEGIIGAILSGISTYLLWSKTNLEVMQIFMANILAIYVSMVIAARCGEGLKRYLQNRK